MNVAVIPARPGSRRIPGKNFRDFCGKPIIEYAIQAAADSGLFDRIYISSDGDNCYRLACATKRDFEKPMVIGLARDPELLEDNIGTQDVMAHVLANRHRPHDAACCIYPCAPLMTAGDLRRGYDLMNRTAEYVYVPGWFYWGHVHWFRQNQPLSNAVELGVADRWIDINTEDEWALAEERYKQLDVARRLAFALVEGARRN